MNNILNTELDKFKILYPNTEFYFFEEIDSTNNFCKTLAKEDFSNPTVVLSDTQSCGRGTKGRSWTSPKGTGLWFSILLKPNFPPKFLGSIPLLTATAIYESLSEFGIKSSIKWPNDIFIKDKKVCGILTESNLSNNKIEYLITAIYESLSEFGIKSSIKWPNDIFIKDKKVCGILTESNLSNNKIEYLIVGIGINVNLSFNDFDPELQDKATSLKISYNKDFNRFDILNVILKNFNSLYYKLTEDKIKCIIENYKANSCVLNKKVSLHYNNTYEIVTPIDVMNDGSLLVKDTNNKSKQIHSGEVSLRF